MAHMTRDIPLGGMGRARLRARIAAKTENVTKSLTLTLAIRAGANANDMTSIDAAITAWIPSYQALSPREKDVWAQSVKQGWVDAPEGIVRTMIVAYNASLTDQEYDFLLDTFSHEEQEAWDAWYLDNIVKS
jgi:hypothetical protein